MLEAPKAKRAKNRRDGPSSATAKPTSTVPDLEQIDRSMVSRLIEFLIPFRTCSQKLEGNTYPTLPYALPVFECLRKHCLRTNTDCNVLAAIREKALYLLYDKVELKMEHKVACLLWPQMKTLISLSEAERELVRLYSKINKLIKSGLGI